MKTHKTLWCIFACLLIGLLMPVMAWSADDIAAKTAYNALKRVAPDVQLCHQDNHIARIYGQAFAHGSSAINSAEQLRLNYAPLLGISAEDLRPVSVFNDKLSTQQVMFDQETAVINLRWYIILNTKTIFRFSAAKSGCSCLIKPITRP
jgi:hypothetical protein